VVGVVTGFACLWGSLVRIYPANHIEKAFRQQSGSGSCDDYALGDFRNILSWFVFFYEANYRGSV
jgi:hypothetical protein